MSKKRIVVSRAGLTSCPQCSAHIRVASTLGATECPFCSASIMSQPASRTSRRQLLASALGASAGLAVLLGVATGCKTTGGQQPPPDPHASDATSHAADAEIEAQVAPEPVPVPEYGMPAPPPEQALYGAPPAPIPDRKP